MDLWIARAICMYSINVILTLAIGALVLVLNTLTSHRGWLSWLPVDLIIELDRGCMRE